MNKTKALLRNQAIITDEFTNNALNGSAFTNIANRVAKGVMDTLLDSIEVYGTETPTVRNTFLKQHWLQVVELEGDSELIPITETQVETFGGYFEEQVVELYTNQLTVFTVETIYPIATLAIEFHEHHRKYVLKASTMYNILVPSDV